MIQRADRRAQLPLSPAQYRLWFLQRLDGDSAKYNVPVVLRIRGELDRAALRDAVSDLFARHESLRTVFREHDGVPYQVILPAAEVRPELVAHRVADLPAALAEAGRQPFDLATDVPLRARLFEAGADEHVLLLTLHHIATDGWSMDVLSRDLRTAYSARRAGLPPDWAPLPVQYADYTLWQLGLLGTEDDAGSVVARQLDFWRSTLDGLPDELDLPTDRSRPATASFRGDDVDLVVTPELHQHVLHVAQASGTTVFMVLHAAVAALLTRVGAGTDIPVGTPAAGRADGTLDDLVGFFVTTLTLRTDTGGDPTFHELLDRVRQVDLAAYEHQDVPFEHLVEALNPARTLARHPLFQVMLVLEQPGGYRFTLPGLDVESSEPGTGTTKFDLLFTFTEAYHADGAAAGVTGRLEFATDLFDRGTAELLARRFLALLTGLLTDPGRRLSAVDILLPGELEVVLGHGTGRKIPLPELSLPEQFERQAARHPDVEAVRACDGTLTYAQLDADANRLAHLLLARGVGPGHHVGVLLPRGARLVTAFVAILKTGAAYLPIDPTFPAERIATIVDDGTPAAILSTQDTAGAVAVDSLPLDAPDTLARLAAQPSHNPADADRPAPLTLESPSYVVYTSGTTGRPKGVVLPARVLLNLLAFLGTAQPAAPGDRVSQFSAVGFDVSEKEMLIALLTGATLCVPDDDTCLDPDRLAHWLDQHRITVFHAPDLVINAVYQAALEHGLRLDTLRHVSQGGEPLQLSALKRDVHRACPELRLHSTFGPSETHLVARYTAAANPGDWPGGAPPLGTPIWNATIRVLDERLRPVPIGVTGEVYLAGPSLAHGYLNRTGLTAQRFVADPGGSPGERMYRTGDLARWRRDGGLEYAGRADLQVKVRGVRVELGELNSVIAGHPAVASAATVLREDRPGDKRLVAYVVAAPGQRPAPDELHQHVARVLPLTVVPSAFVVLDALPFTANGKLDRGALPAPSHQGTDGRAPSTPDEQVLCRLFAEVLDLPEVGVDDGFFALGGHSLLITKLVNRVRAILGRELPIRAVFETPSPRELARQLDSDVVGDVGGGRARPVLRAGQRPELVPMSYAQARLWFLDQLDGAATTYNLPVSYRITGELDAEVLQRAITDVADRHESLRTVLREVDGRPVQVVLPPAPVPVHRTGTTGSGLAASMARAVDHVFDLSGEPPMRVSLISTAPDDHVLTVLCHHSAGDGWSSRVLVRDLSEAYRARSAGTAPTWAPLPVQYADYALWQRELLGDEDDPGSTTNRQLAYWREALAGAPPELDYPADRSRPATPSQHGEYFEVDLGAQVHRGLAELAARTGCTLSMICHAALAATLTKQGAGTDLPIGTPVSGRTDEGLAELVGLFINTVVLRLDTSGNPFFAELLARVKDASLAAYAHQDVPFDRVVEVVNPPRAAGRNPLFQIMMEVTAGGPGELDLPGTTARSCSPVLDVAKFDLSLLVEAETTAAGEPGPLRALVGYATDLFDPPTVRRLADQLVRVLHEVVADPSVRVDALDVLGDEGRAELLRHGTGPVPDTTTFTESSLQQAFQAQVRRTPDAIAVRCMGSSLTYRELDERANRLAHRLIAAGAGPERPVVTLLSRTTDLLVALTAILKSGSYYVPLHHAAPLERMQWMFDQSGASVLLTDHAMSERGLPRAPVVVPADEPCEFPGTDPEVAGHREQLAYVMYTSGSTGTPKGVAITHQDVLELVSDSTFTPGDHDRVLLLTPYEFDPSTYSFWYPLLHGGTAIIAPEADLTVARLAAVMREERITGVDITAGLFRVMAEEDPECFAGVRVIFTGGDVVSPTAVRRALSHCPGLLVRSNYGPTETTLFATSAPWSTAGQVPAPVPIGRPLDGMRAFVLDDALAMVPVGVTGELYLEGHGLARGYLHRSDLTAERFVACPSGPPGARMYRTGDKVRWTADGLLDFVGRSDNQVKIRGFRIELWEIEAVLAGLPAVRQAAVVAREDRPGDKRLVGYLVAGDDLELDQLDAHLRGRLPDYMVPETIVRLDALPLTANNKVDLRALPAPERARATGRAPRTETESVLCALFTDLLGVERVGVDDNFFELGGHSLLATRLVSRIRARLQRELTVREVFEAPTPAGLGGRLSEPVPAARPALRPAARPDLLPLSPAQFRLWFLGKLEDPSEAYTLPVEVRLRGTLDVAALRAALGDVFARHEVLRTVFREHEGVPHQMILPVEQARPALVAESVDDLSRALRVAGLEPFDLSTDVPLRARLFVVPGDGLDDHVLHLTFHHIGGDGQSMRPLMRDLHEAYAARTAGTAPSWAPLPVQYADYALWQQELLGTADGADSLTAGQLRLLA